MNTIDEFLKTGRLGRLGKGITTEEVREWLGDPEGTSGKGWPQLWKYGSLQLGFHRASSDEVPSLISIGLYFRVEDQSPPEALALTGWAPRHGCTFTDFEHHLDEAGIATSGGVISETHKHLIVGPGVRVTFEDDVLDSIQHTARREPERKQLTVSVRRQNLDRIRAEARARGISVSTLCSEWIDDQARGLARVGELTSTSRPG